MKKATFNNVVFVLLITSLLALIIFPLVGCEPRSTAPFSVTQSGRSAYVGEIEGKPLYCTKVMVQDSGACEFHYIYYIGDVTTTGSSTGGKHSVNHSIVTIDNIPYIPLEQAANKVQAEISQ